jgi:hypothetical protein
MECTCSDPSDHWFVYLLASALGKSPAIMQALAGRLCDALLAGVPGLAVAYSSRPDTNQQN